MKRTAKIVTGVAAVAALTLAGYGLFSLGMSRGMNMSGGSMSGDTSMSSDSIAAGEAATRRHIKDGLKAGDTDPQNGKKVIYYHDPMVPGKKFDVPGKSPFMDMMLVPAYSGGEEDQGKVTVSPRIQQNLGIRTAEVLTGSLKPSLEVVGNIAYNERDQSVVQARATGYVERLYVRATLDRVAEGQALADIYVPDWVAAQEEFLAVWRMQGNDLTALVDAARSRMRQAGMSDAQIRLIEADGKLHPRLTLTAPSAGIVSELIAREGMTVMSGATLFRINGLGTVWANAEIPESQAALVRVGATLEARTLALPDAVFSGRVQAILPEVNTSTRTLKARVELSNRQGKLVPGMFVTMKFDAGKSAPALLIPSEAVIQTGIRAVVFVMEEGDKFRPVDVVTGFNSNGQTEIKQGLQAGQMVVTSGQFLLDSEASLKSVETRMQAAPTMKPAEKVHSGNAKVEALGKGAATLSHGPIESMKMGAMTMDFGFPKAGLPKNIAVGDQVQFEFMMTDDGPTLTSITPVAQSPAPAPGKAKP